MDNSRHPCFTSQATGTVGILANLGLHFAEASADSRARKSGRDGVIRSADEVLEMEWDVLG